jgi:hypothetical protein
MADNKITIACPVCGTGSATTTTTTDTDSTTTTTSGAPTDANAPTSTPPSPKVEHAIGNSTVIATASSTSIQHTYDLTGYQIPIQAEGIIYGLHSLHTPIEVEAIERENPALDALIYPKRAIHAINVEGMTSSGTRKNQREGTKKDPLGQPVTLIFNCPVKQQTFQATLVRENQDGPITIVEVEAISPDNSMLLDVGKQIASDSLKVSSSFCTSMIATSTGAIGVYTALFAIVLPKTCTIGIGYGLLAILPALVFIAAAVGFAYGAFPIHGSFMAADPHSIETYRDQLFSLRMSRLRGSFALFCIAMVLAVIVVVLVAATHVGCAA